MLMECLAQDHISFLTTLQPRAFLYILESISEGLTALGKLNDKYLMILSDSNIYNAFIYLF